MNGGVTCTDLVVLQTILKDVLDHQTAGLSQGDLMPHTTKGIVDKLHDLGWGLSPPQLEQLLPDMTGVSVNDRLRDATEQLVDHDGLVVLWDRIERLLNDVATEGIHRQVEGVATDGFGNLDDLLWSAVLEAALNEKVAKTIDHERIGLGNDRLDNIVLLLRGADLELLLKEDGRLLVVVADDLVNNVLPVTVDIAVKEAPVVQRLGGWQIRLSLSGNGLDEDNVSDAKKMIRGS